MKILCCGSREYTDAGCVMETLRTFSEIATRRHAALEVCHGDATGADQMVARACRELGISCTAFPADWNGPLGKAAGPARNAQMLKTFKPDLVLAFYPGPPKAPPGTKGTLDMVRKALKAGVDVWHPTPGGACGRIWEVR